MKMYFMHVFLLLPALNNALLLRLELMASWIFHEDHFVKPVKVLLSAYMNFLYCQQYNLSRHGAYHICFLNKIGVTFTAIHNLANNYREDFKFPNLKLTFKNRQGFHFVIPQKNIQGKLPSKFIQVRD